MNYYIVVEGETELSVYKSWICQQNPTLTPVDYIDEIVENNFLIRSGMGYPQYKEMIVAGIEDMKQHTQIDYLIVAVDSEKMSFEEKYREIDSIIQPIARDIQYKIIVQHFCLEAWFLGNRKIVKQHPHQAILREYVRFYDVKQNDPELLPDYPKTNLSRVKFADKYFKKIVNEHKNLSYSKRNPYVVMDKSFLLQLKKRLVETEHIQSIRYFFEIFDSTGEPEKERE